MESNSGLSPELMTNIKARIETMEAPGYEFPEKFSALDWLGAIALIIASLISIVAGVWM